MPQKILKIYPWTFSVTGNWSIDRGLYQLRDYPPEQLAESLWNMGMHVQQTAVIELMAHGNPRKAAEFVRALIDQRPDLESDFRFNTSCTNN